MCISQCRLACYSAFWLVSWTSSLSTSFRYVTLENWYKYMERNLSHYFSRLHSISFSTTQSLSLSRLHSLSLFLDYTVSLSFSTTQSLSLSLSLSQLHSLSHSYHHNNMYNASDCSSDVDFTGIQFITTFFIRYLFIISFLWNSSDAESNFACIEFCNRV